jgi:vancomycin aglycone glucosyltransferase
MIDSLWAQEEQSWNDLFRDTLNEERDKLGLEPVESVSQHIFTKRPWLAADPTGARGQRDRDAGHADSGLVSR